MARFPRRRYVYAGLLHERARSTAQRRKENCGAHVGDTASDNVSTTALERASGSRGARRQFLVGWNTDPDPQRLAPVWPRSSQSRHAAIGMTWLPIELSCMGNPIPRSTEDGLLNRATRWCGGPWSKPCKPSAAVRSARPGSRRRAARREHRQGRRRPQTPHAGVLRAARRSHPSPGPGSVSIKSRRKPGARSLGV